MKILILNGSPRPNGNTAAAIEAVRQGIEAELPQAELEIINANEQRVQFCQNCDSCKRNGGRCVCDDDSNEVLDKLQEAEALIFATPVYWWGMTAQLKTIIDKMYARSDDFKKLSKKVGLITVGGAAVTNQQYQLISDQFKCICQYLNWQKVFDEPISAYQAGDLAADRNKLAQLRDLWKTL